MDYQGERCEAKPVVIVEDRAMRRWSSMWEEIARFYGRTYTQTRRYDGEKLFVESDEFDGYPVQCEGGMRREINLAREHDVGVPWDPGDVFCMFMRQVRVEAKVTRLRSERLGMEQRSRDLREAVANVRTELEKVRMEKISGFKKLEADFEAGNTQLTELHCISHEKSFEIGRLRNTLQQGETKAV